MTGEMIKASAVLLVSSQEREKLNGEKVTEKVVALARRSDDAKVYPGHWECPCGKQERIKTSMQFVGRMEFALDTAVREVAEETGLVPASEGFNLNWLEDAGTIITHGPGPLKARVAMYLCEIPLTDLKHTEPTKRGPWQWVELWRFARSWAAPEGPFTIATRTLIEIALINYGLKTEALKP